MNKAVSFLMVLMVLMVFGFLCVSNLTAQEEKKELSEEDAKLAMEKLKEAMLSLKKEIKTEVSVENGGSISGTVKCKRVRHPENVVVYIEIVGDNNFPAPEEHGIVDQLNLTFVPHVIAVQKGATLDFPNSDIVRHNVFSPPECCKTV